MEITNDLILKLENLAKLKLTDVERDRLKGELGKIIEMFSDISEVNTDEVLPLIHMTDTFNSLRQDETGKQLTLDEVAGNAPKLINKMFAVPKVIE